MGRTRQQARLQSPADSKLHPQMKVLVEDVALWRILAAERALPYGWIEQAAAAPRVAATTVPMAIGGQNWAAMTDPPPVDAQARCVAHRHQGGLRDSVQQRAAGEFRKHGPRVDDRRTGIPVIFNRRWRRRLAQATGMRRPCRRTLESECGCHSSPTRRFVRATSAPRSAQGERTSFHAPQP